MDLPDSTSDESPNKNEDVDAANVIRNVLSENGIEGDNADQIVNYYLEKVDETHATLNDLYAQGRDASANMGFLAMGAEDLKALYETGKLSLYAYIRYSAALENRVISSSEAWELSATERGAAIEKALAKTEYKDWYNVGAENNGYFPIIDFQKDNWIGYNKLDRFFKGIYNDFI